MKYIKSLLLLLFLSSNLMGQGFAEIGTKWEYCFMHDYEIPPTESFAHIKIESSHELQYMGMSCMVLKIVQDVSVLTNDSIIVCEANNVIFFVDDDSLKVLYDFNLFKGDTFYFSFPQQLFTGFYEEYVDEYALAMNPTAAIVIEVDSVMVDGSMLKRQIINPIEYILSPLGIRSRSA